MEKLFSDLIPLLPLRQTDTTLIHIHETGIKKGHESHPFLFYILSFTASTDRPSSSSRPTYHRVLDDDYRIKVLYFSNNCTVSYDQGNQFIFILKENYMNRFQNNYEIIFEINLIVLFLYICYSSTISSCINKTFLCLQVVAHIIS